MSRTLRIKILLAIDLAFFFLELIGESSGLSQRTMKTCDPHSVSPYFVPVGYSVGSLALVADSFHVCYNSPPFKAPLDDATDFHSLFRTFFLHLDAQRWSISTQPPPDWKRIFTKLSPFTPQSAHWSLPYMQSSLLVVPIAARSIRMVGNVLRFWVGPSSIFPNILSPVPDIHHTFLGALINGVFLLALCFSIFLEAIQRAFNPSGTHICPISVTSIHSLTDLSLFLLLLVQRFKIPSWLLSSVAWAWHPTS